MNSKCASESELKEAVSAVRAEHEAAFVNRYRKVLERYSG